MRRILWIALAVTCGLVQAVCVAGEPRPNIVFFLVDDMGWTDLGCYGSTFHETPHIDALAKSGLRFTDAYTAASICSPTRASIMTGKHPVRVNITDWIPGARFKNPKLKTPEDIHQLPLEEVTIAEALQEAGYQTWYGGKWHLGDAGFAPTDQGFDVYYDELAESKKLQGNARNKKKRALLLTSSQDLTDQAVGFINGRDKDRPFFLYLSYNDVHTPIQPIEPHVGHYHKKAERFEGDTPKRTERNGKTRLRQDNANYASMVAAVDTSVGRILGELDKLGLADSTIVVFFSDNGGLSTTRWGGPASVLPLRAGKGWLYEGGIRVPLIVRVPRVTKAGRTTDVPVVSMDLYPTLLELAGVPQRPDQHADGLSIVRVLEGADSLGRDALYWHYPHYHGSTWTPGAAIRVGDWKLVEFYEQGAAELYHLKSDIAESRDLFDKHPAKKQELLDRLHAWQKQLNAGMPVPMGG